MDNDKDFNKEPGLGQFWTRSGDKDISIKSVKAEKKKIQIKVQKEIIDIVNYKS